MPYFEGVALSAHPLESGRDLHSLVPTVRIDSFRVCFDPAPGLHNLPGGHNAWCEHVRQLSEHSAASLVVTPPLSGHAREGDRQGRLHPGRLPHERWQKCDGTHTSTVVSGDNQAGSALKAAERQPAPDAAILYLAPVVEGLHPCMLVVLALTNTKLAVTRTRS